MWVAHYMRQEGKVRKHKVSSWLDGRVDGMPSREGRCYGVDIPLMLEIERSTSVENLQSLVKMNLRDVAASL